MTSQDAMNRFDDTPVVRDLQCGECSTPLQQSAITTEGGHKTWHWETR